MLNKKLYCILFLFALLSGCGNNQNQKSAGNIKDTISQTKPRQAKNILFFGNSLTAGLGVEPEEAFPAIIKNKIDSLNLPYNVINAGLSGETSAAGKARINWLLKQRVDVFVLELGANDGLRGIPVEETSKNLQNIINQVKGKYPDVKLVMAGMEVPPNMGKKYTTEFND